MISENEDGVRTNGMMPQAMTEEQKADLFSENVSTGTESPENGLMLAEGVQAVPDLIQTVNIGGESYESPAAEQADRIRETYVGGEGIPTTNIDIGVRVYVYYEFTGLAEVKTTRWYI